MKLESQATTETALATGVQVAVIDTRLKDYQQIVAALSPSMHIVLLDAASDGLAVIAKALAHYSNVTALHLFSHASPASVQLGSSYLNSSTINTSAALSTLKSIGSSLTQDGMILLYGCDLAEGSIGQNFVSQFASLTGVTVGASSNTTGAAAFGGDWHMEVIATPNGSFLPTHAGVQNTANAIAVSLIDYQQSLAGLITATNEVSIATGNDYIHTTPGTTPMATLGAVELANDSRVLLQANNKADYYGMANLDFLSVVVIDTLGNKSTIALSGTVATVVNNNGATTNNSSSIQTNDAASIVALRTGGFVVSSYSNDGYGVQLYNNAGVSQSISAPATYTSSVNPSAKVLASQDGGFVLLWTKTNDTTNEVTASYQRYTSSGSLSGSTYSKVFASTTPVVQNAAIDMHGNIAIPISSNDVYTRSQVILWNAANVEVGTFNTVYYQSAAVIAPMYGGGFDLFGNDISSGVGNTASSFYVQTLGADGSLGLPVASAIPVANLRAVELSLSGDYLAVGGATDNANLGYFVDGFNPGAGTTTQSIADAAKVASIPTLSEDGDIVSAWITSPVTNDNGLVTSGAVSVVTYGTAFTTPVDYPPTIAGTFTTSGALTDKTNILPFASLTVSDVDSVSGKVTITYNAANGSLSGTGLSGTAGNYELATTALTTITTQLRALVFTPTENQIVPNSTVQTTFTITPNDGVRDGRANTASNAIATSINDVPVINNNGSAASANTNLAENLTAVMTFTTTDPDVGQTITYSKSGADAALFHIDPTTGVLTFITAPNFEIPTDAGGDNVYNVTITSSDGLASDSQAIAVTVTNVNENPVISSNDGGPSANINAAENQLAVTVVAADDVDAATTLTYSVSGTDAALFDINSSNGTLTFKTNPNFEAPTDNGGNNIYNVIVTASDGSLTDTQALAITVTNVNDAPTITGLSAADNQTVSTSASPVLIDIASAAIAADEDNANFNSGNLTVSFGSGRQTGDALAIRTGSGVTLSSGMAVASTITIDGQIIGSIATSGTGAGGDSLIVNFTAQATPTRVSTLLQNLTFDATSNAGDRALNIRVNDGAANSSTASLTISVTTNPTVEISSSAGPLKAGETALINFQFSESPIGFTESDISVSGGTISNLTVNGGDNKIYTALFTPAADTQSLSGSISIGAGTFTNADSEDNLASAVNASLTGDTLAPTVTSIVRASTTPTNATSVDFTITFAETVSGVDIGDFDLNTTNGVIGSVASISGGGNTYTVTVNNLTGEGNLRLDLKSTSTGIVDALSNPIAGGFTGGQSFTFERTAPTVTSILRTQSDNTNAATLTYDVLFSENVSGVDINDFKLYATTSAAGQIASVTGNGSEYTVTVNNVSGMGTLRLDLAQQDTDIKDVANNSFSAGFTSGEAYTIDRIAPTVDSITRVGNALSNNSSISYTVTFSETITGLDVTDFALTTTNSAEGRIASLSGSGSTYVIVVEDITGDGTIRLDLNDSATGINDSYSNTIKTGFATGEVFTIDRLTPDAPGPLDLISSSDTGSSNSDNKTIDSSPGISGSAEANATIKIYSGNQLLTSTSADNAGKWTVASLDLTTGSHTLTATATDSAGNTSLASSALTIEIANPNIISASYDASAGQLLVTSSGLLNGDTIQSEKLSVSGQNGASYTLSSGNFTALSATQFTVTLNAADKLIVNGLLNLNGTRAVDNTLFNLSAASDWDYTVGANSDTSNPITVTNLSTPTISSASYNADTNVLQVTGNNLIKRIGSLNDISVSKLNIRGEAGLSYTLSSDDVELINGNSFAITLNPTDQLQVEALFNKNGYSSTGGTVYNLSATDDWNSVIGNTDTSVTSASINVSQIAMPSIISAGYDVATGILSVVGTGLKSLGGNANDIISNRLSLVGEGATPYRLTSANVDIISASTFNISLNSADKAAIHLFLNKDGESSTSGTEYNLIADDNWAAGVDVALDITDNANNPIAVMRVAKPSITSATYKPSTKTIEVSGANFLSFAGVSNDILSNHLQFTGALGGTFKLTDTSNVDIKNGNSFTVTLSASDNLALAALFNKKGTSSTDNTPYNLALLENWNQGADASIDIADIFNNPVEVIGVAPVTSNVLIKFNEDQTSVLSLSNFAFNDSDANDSLQSILITALPTIGQLRLDGTTVSLNQQISASDVSAGKLRFTPLSNGNGKNYDGFGFKVSDGDMLSNDARVSFEVVPVNDPLIGGVTVSGKTNVGQTLFATNNISDADGFTSLTYQWLANDISIRGAIKSSYVLSSADVGKKITVLVSYLDFGNTFESTSFTTSTAVTDLNKAPSGTVQISGQLIQGQTLMVSNNITDLDGMGAIQYQWKADGQNIANSNASTLVLTQEQVNKKITVEANYVDGKGNTESVNSNTSTSVQNVNDLPTGDVQIAGTALVGQVLSVINTLADLDGLGVMRHQWLADGVAIRGATSSSYVLRDRDIGKTITVAVSYTDSFSTPEKVTSMPTDIIRSALFMPKIVATAQAPAPMQFGMKEIAIYSIWEQVEQRSDLFDRYFAPTWPEAQDIEFGSPTLIGIENQNDLTTFFLI